MSTVKGSSSEKAVANDTDNVRQGVVEPTLSEGHVAQHEVRLDRVGRKPEHLAQTRLRFSESPELQERSTLRSPRRGQQLSRRLDDRASSQRR